MNFLSDMVQRIRSNHAMEHATINVITEAKPGVRLMGRSSPWGFYIYGPVDTVDLANAAAAALARLKLGEDELAVHPACGTNFVVAGMMAGFASFAALGGQGRFRKLPQAVAAATMAVLLAQPVGRWAQQRLTTSTDMEGMEIRGITRRSKGRMNIHFVELSRE